MTKKTSVFVAGGMVLALTGLAVTGRAAQKPLHPDLADFRAPVEKAEEHVRGFLWLEAEGFADYGEWRLDTQFTHKMGSAYLIAPGVGSPIGDAKALVRFPRAGRWQAWVRTKDWFPSHSPGRFTITVDGREGRVLGASGKEGWRWESAGAFDLAAGEREIRLKDLSGAFARCDALLFTDRADYVPPSADEAVATERLRLTGRPTAVADFGPFDVVVVGSGTAGMGAALAAARTGARTALVHDRPVLGGNSSVELGVGTDGAAITHPNARETGLCEEANLLTRETKSLTGSYRLMVEREKNLTVYPNVRILSAEKKGEAIAAVCGRSTLTGARSRYRATLFIDATGDGWVGVFAGAARMYGREAQTEFGEWPAPEKRDDLTMSGCLMDRSLCYSYAVGPRAVAYETPAWAADVLPKGFTRHIRHIGPDWWIEHGGRFDDLADPERARDELVRIAFAYWGWIKNASPLQEKARNAYLTFVPYMNGRREGYRLEGDYILTANDCLAGRIFPDRISYGGWPLDTHDPLGIENPNGNGYWKHHPPVPIYSIPFRCLYSKNVPNLLFAGRCASVTHIALGSVRVEATLFTLGQAAGTAAALACAKGMMPRAYGKAHIAELQQRLLKDDMYIPELANADPLDLARTARASATSGSDGLHRVFDMTDPDLLNPSSPLHPMTMPRAVRFDVEGTRLDALSCLLVSSNAAPVRMRAALYAVTGEKATPAEGECIAQLEATVPPMCASFVRFLPTKAVRLTEKETRLWLVLYPGRDVYWRLRRRPIPGGIRAWGSGKDWKPVTSEQYSFLAEPALSRAIRDSSPAAVIDGVSRPIGESVHGWVSDPKDPLPQSLRLDFPKAVRAHQVRLTFDTDLTPTRTPLYSPMLVKAYLVEGLVGGEWKVLASDDENGLRHRVHDFPETELTALRVTVLETWGDRSARIFELRVY